MPFLPAQSPLTIATFEGFAPFAWRDSSGVQGRDIAFLERFAASENRRLVVEFHGFDRLWEVPAQGKADIAAGGISMLPGKRCCEVAWSTPYSDVRRTVMNRARDEGKFQAMSDFSGAVVPGSAADVHARETLPPHSTLVHCPTLQEGIEALLAGKVDGVGTGSISAKHHVATRRGLAIIDVHHWQEPEFVSFAVRRESQLLVRRNAFIGEHAASYCNLLHFDLDAANPFGEHHE